VTHTIRITTKFSLGVSPTNEATQSLDEPCFVECSKHAEGTGIESQQFCDVEKKPEITTAAVMME